MIPSADLIGTTGRRRQAVGTPIYSNWLTINQSMIDRFADVTCDHQFIHVDPERALASAFGGTIAHGFLPLSLLTHLLDTVVEGPLSERYYERELWPGPRALLISRADGIAGPGGGLDTTEVTEKRPGQFPQVLDVILKPEGSDIPALVGIWRYLHVHITPAAWARHPL